MSEQLQVTSGAAWRSPRTEGYLIQLPSGCVARLRPVALDVLIQNVTIPDLLSDLAAKSLWEETASETIAADPKLALQYMQLINCIVPAAMLEPVIVESPSAENEIALDDLDFTDKLSVFNLAIGPVEALRRFRDKQRADLQALSDRKDDGQQAEPVGGDR